MATSETNITVSCSTEYNDYSYNASHDIWALVSLKAPCQEEEEDDKRAPIDIVAVLDKSGSMAGEKLKLVKRTMEFVLTQLTEKDHLALVTYDTNVYVDFGFMKMTKENKESALRKIKAIENGDSTNLSGGLIKGLVQIIDRAVNTKNEVASVLLFTDGLANAGITSAEGIVAAMKNPRCFDGPTSGGQQGGCMKKSMKKRTKQMRPLPPLPDFEDSPPSDDDKDPSGQKPADASVYTFGFGKHHNEDMLTKISEAGNGMYYFIETEDKIGESFAHCLGGLMSTVAQGIQLQVVMETGVVIKEVHSTRPFEKEGDQSVKVNIGDLQSEESRDIVLELSLAPVNAPHETTPQPLLNVNVDFFNVVTNNTGNTSASLGVLRPANEAAHDDATVNPIVTKEKCRVSMTKAMKEADTKANTGDYDGAKVLLTSQINKMKQCREMVSKYHSNADLEEMYETMADDLDECRINASSASVWEQKGKKMNKSKAQMYGCQRSSEAQAKAFKTKKKGASVAASKMFFQEEEE